MPYNKLLSHTRFKSTSLPGRSLIVEAESDRSRLVFSPPFRRLQQKAQVFSLEANAAVRSRLTHTLEVAQIGRFLGDLIVEKLTEENLIDTKQARAFVTFVETACLMHDLGNPPFGHFGEAAISNWFKENGEKLLKESTNNPNILKFPENTQDPLLDFYEFDGNCQGLRIATLLQWNDHEHGLNLTLTSLASYLKYIRPPHSRPADIKHLLFQKKAGFFSTEISTVHKIWAHFEYKSDTPQRFPLAYIMEAADDIAYCISDLEDSIEKELLNANIVFEQLIKKWESKISEIPQDDTFMEISRILNDASKSDKNINTTFTVFRTSLSTILTEIACKTYCKNHESIINGECKGLIPEHSSGGAILNILKDFCREHVYQHWSVERKELAGLNAIRGLLDHYSILLKCSKDRFLAALDNKTKDNSNNLILIERKLLSLFPERYKEAYRFSLNEITNCNECENSILLKEWNLRAHLITDFISGMTDDFALWSFQIHSGIRFE